MRVTLVTPGRTLVTSGIAIPEGTLVTPDMEVTGIALPEGPPQPQWPIRSPQQKLAAMRLAYNAGVDAPAWATQAEPASTTADVDIALLAELGQAVTRGAEETRAAQRLAQQRQPSAASSHGGHSERPGQVTAPQKPVTALVQSIASPL